MADNEKLSARQPLKPTIWMTGVLVWATAIGLFLKIPTWAEHILVHSDGTLISALYGIVHFSPGN